MKFLIDTNIVVPLEPAEPQDLAANTDAALQFHRLAANTGNEVFVHPAIHYDLDRDKNEERAEIRRTALTRYNMLHAPPVPAVVADGTLGTPDEGSNDWVDNHFLGAVVADTVDYLVTEDVGIHRKARRIGSDSRVILLADAVGILRDLFDTNPVPPPTVEDTFAYQLDQNDPIFDTLRVDYAGFDEWLAKCKREHRKAFVVRSTHGAGIAALCIYKREDALPDGREGKVLKLCTFKVAPHETGNRYGELLLKTVFDYIYENDYQYAYFTAYPQRTDILDFAEDFGFYQIGEYAETGERLVVKEMSLPPDLSEDFSPLDLHRRFGPRAVVFQGNATFMVPIQPQYHRMLFPEDEKQTLLGFDVRPCGNSLKKAYLCRSNIKKVKPGNNLVFYRSEDEKRVTAVGIVEDTLRCDDPQELARYVGKRTVYTFDEIRQMCNREVLAIRFRLVARLGEPVTLDELKDHGVVTAAPQSISELKGESIEWLRQRMGL